MLQYSFACLGQLSWLPTFTGWSGSQAFGMSSLVPTAAQDAQAAPSVVQGSMFHVSKLHQPCYKRCLQQTLCLGRPIVSETWVEACGRSSSFVDPLDHLLIDKAAQKKFGFDMRTSYEHAQHQLLLVGLRIFFTPGETVAALFTIWPTFTLIAVMTNMEGCSWQ